MTDESDKTKTGPPASGIDEWSTADTLPMSDDPGYPPESEATTTGVSIGIECFADRYEILGLIGQGGMGSVYRVHDVELDEVVALKTLHDELAQTDAAIERFRAEVRLARRVTHRNVARTYDLGMSDGVPFLTMEYVEGESLDQLIASRARMPWAEALSVTIEICRGLAAAHEAGVVHRDLKPQNVLVDDEGRVVLSDFGIARARDASRRQSRLVGTPAYMAPEQVQGEATDGRADIYALGVMLFEMVSGELPWQGKTPVATALMRMVEPLPPFDEHLGVPDDVRGLIERCLEVDPADRYPNVTDLEAATRKILDRSSGAHSAAQRSLREVLSSFETRRSSGDKSVAVLPLKYRADPDLVHLCEGLHEELVDELSMCRGLAVKPRGAVLEYSADDVEPLRAGRQLGVQVVVEGTFRILAGRLRIRLAAVSVEDGFRLWSERFDGEVRDLFEMTAEACDAIADALTVHGAPDNRDVMTDPKVIDLYMRARRMMRLHWHTHLERAEPLWEEALDLAPDDPRVLAGAATYFARRSFLDRDPELTLRAGEYAGRAVDAAPLSPEPYCARAVLAWNRADFVSALRNTRRALDLAPGYVEAHVLLGKVLMEIGSVEEATEHLNAAHAADPREYNARWELVRAHAMLGDWDEVDTLLELPVDETEARYWQAVARARSDLWRDEPQWLDAPAPEVDSEFELAFFVTAARALARRGELDEELEVLLGIAEVFADTYPRTASVVFQIATEFAAYSGKEEMASDTLQRSLDLGLVDINWLRLAPVLEPLRGLEWFRHTVETVESRVAAIHAEAKRVRQSS